MEMWRKHSSAKTTTAFALATTGSNPKQHHDPANGDDGVRGSVVEQAVAAVDPAAAILV
jgi:hypothetical protein